MTMTRMRSGMVLATVVAMLLIAIGVNILVRTPASTGIGRDGLLLFAVREVFLGVLCILLVLFKEWRALLLLFVIALILPIADSLLLYNQGNHPLRVILVSNLPFELPLILVCVLLAPALRAKNRTP